MKGLRGDISSGSTGAGFRHAENATTARPHFTYRLELRRAVSITVSTAATGMGGEKGGRTIAVSGIQTLRSHLPAEQLAPFIYIVRYVAYWGCSTGRRPLRRNQQLRSSLFTGSHYIHRHHRRPAHHPRALVQAELLTTATAPTVSGGS